MPAAIFLVAGEFAPRLHLVDLFFTSQPSRVMAASVDVLRCGTLMDDAIVSLSEFGAGFARAMAIGYDVLCAIIGGLLP